MFRPVPVVKRKVLIVDDHPIVRQGLRSMIDAERDLRICGEAETEKEARAAIRTLAPDVVVAVMVTFWWWCPVAIGWVCLPRPLTVVRHLKIRRSGLKALWFCADTLHVDPTR